MNALQRVTLVLLFTSTSASGADPKFERQVIDGEIQIGYGLALGRVDGDSKVDILLADQKEIVWYQNPGEAGQRWEKHVIARNLTARDNVCLAARDITGDGLVEIAVGANWNPGNTTDRDVSGTSFYLQRPADPTKPWKPIPLEPHEPTTHRMHWIKDGEGRMRLAVLPLHGVGNQDGAGRSAMVSLFEIVDGQPKFVGKTDTTMHKTHNFELVVDRAFGTQEIMLIAGAEGYVVANVDGESLGVVGSPLSDGAGEVRRMPVEERVFVGIEPMHGTNVVIYTSQGEGEWTKEIIDATLNAGHALGAANLFGSSDPEVVAGWRTPDAHQKVGIKVYSKTAEAWSTHVIDDNQIACEDLKLADLNGDGKIDIIGAGRATKNVVIYWNRCE